MATSPSDLTIAQLRVHKDMLEQFLLRATATALQEFEKETGLTPSAIAIDLVRVDQVGQPRAKWVVGEVRAHVDL